MKIRLADKYEFQSEVNAINSQMYSTCLEIINHKVLRTVLQLTHIPRSFGVGIAAQEAITNINRT